MSIKSVKERSSGPVLEEETKSEKKNAAPSKERPVAQIVDEAKARALATATLTPPCGIRHIFGNTTLTVQQELAMKVLISAAALMMTPAGTPGGSQDAPS